MTTTDVTTQTNQSRSRRFGPLAVAAATVLAAGGLMSWQITTTTASAAPVASVSLTVRPSDGAARCAAPTVDVLRTNTTAFEGTVTSVRGDRVTFREIHWYLGTPASTVTITRRYRLEGVTFTTGGHYLVAAENRMVEPCGGTMEADHRMRELYARAFPVR
jgi:hypothetical protein